MIDIKNLIKKLFITNAVLVLGICAVLLVTFWWFYNLIFYPKAFALTDNTFTDNKNDLEYVAEFAYDLYENRKAERKDLEYVYIRLGTSGWQVWYGYEDDISHWDAVSDDTFNEAVHRVNRAFPSPGGEFSVDIRAMEGSVEFVGYEYSLIYSADGGKPRGFEERKLERVEFFSDKWYHCYNKKVKEP